MNNNIAIISLNTIDFQSWIKKNLKLSGIEYINKFKTDNKTYFCITSVLDLCSKRFDKIFETTDAKKNKYYQEIIQLIKLHE